MKKVSFLKLNFPKENILSKEERKKLIGGSPNTCYVTCNNGPGYSLRVDDCIKGSDFCNSYEGVRYCYCESN